jgi:hypothetical protein
LFRRDEGCVARAVGVVSLDVETPVRRKDLAFWCDGDRADEIAAEQIRPDDAARAEGRVDRSVGV